MIIIGKGIPIRPCETQAVYGHLHV